MKNIAIKAKPYIFLILAAASLVSISWNCTSSSAETGAIPDEIDYNFHIRPILSDIHPINFTLTQ